MLYGINGFIYLVVVDIEQVSKMTIFCLIPVPREIFFRQDGICDPRYCQIALQKVVDAIRNGLQRFREALEVIAIVFTTHGIAYERGQKN